jgi:hypothetical protein
MVARLLLAAIALLAAPVVADAATFGLAEVRDAGGHALVQAGPGRFGYRGAVRIGSAHVLGAPQRAVLWNVSMLGGRVRAARVVVPARGLLGARVDGLTVDGVPYPSRPNTLASLGGGSYLVVLQAAVAPGLTSTSVGLVGLRVHVGHAEAGAPAGSELWAGIAAAARRGAGAAGAAATGAASEIPPGLIPLYQRAARRYGVPWTTLAAINKAETGFGRDLRTSYAGAVGWMQFLPSTWRRYGLDGNRDGRRDPMSPYDAIPSAAAYLQAAGAGVDLTRAIFAYNHSDRYVAEVMAQATAYSRSGSPHTAGPLDPAQLGGR